MKKLFLNFLILLSFTCVRAQQTESEISKPISDSLPDNENISTLATAESRKFSAQNFVITQKNSPFTSEGEHQKLFPKLVVTDLQEKESDEAQANPFSGRKTNVQKKQKEKFHWKSALIQSGIFLGIQHGFRMIQEKTTRELGGPFFRDWAQSVKNLRGWRDGDSSFINYVAHPLQGGVTGRIFINNSDRAKRQEFGKSKEYWESRFKVFVWSAVWSTQFELGPISEASLGNVGLRKKFGYSTMSLADLVITPILGTGVVIIEDIFDKYLLKNRIEKKFSNKVVVKFFRILLNPTTAFSNILRVKMPWYRDHRPL